MLNLPDYDTIEDIKSMIARKFGRLNALRGREAQNESVQDTWIDLAVYAVLGVVASRREVEEYA
jgi:hypothetical protein